MRAQSYRHILTASQQAILGGRQGACFRDGIFAAIAGDGVEVVQDISGPLVANIYCPKKKKVVICIALAGIGAFHL